MELSVMLDSIRDEDFYDLFVNEFRKQSRSTKNSPTLSLKIRDKEISLSFGLELEERNWVKGRRKATFTLHDHF